MTVCRTCFQPECPETTGAAEEQYARPRPGRYSSRLQPGEHEPRGYGEWAIHPEEARFVLHRGYAVVNGERQFVRWIQNEPLVTEIYVEGTGS